MMQNFFIQGGYFVVAILERHCLQFLREAEYVLETWWVASFPATLRFRMRLNCYFRSRLFSRFHVNLGWFHTSPKIIEPKITLPSLIKVMYFIVMQKVTFLFDRSFHSHCNHSILNRFVAVVLWFWRQELQIDFIVNSKRIWYSWELIITEIIVWVTLRFCL